MRKLRVVVVDDSALMRALLKQIIEDDGDMLVVGMAPDPFVAREKIRELDPDVITLDIEMPKMDGISFLEKLMRLRPTPVVMVSTLTEAGAEATLAALELGAVDFISKPCAQSPQAILDYAEVIRDKLRVAAKSQPRLLSQRVDVVKTSAPPVTPQVSSGAKRFKYGLIAVGASTGGTEAIRHFLQGIPSQCPPIAMVQHMPVGFTASFAARLDKSSAVHVYEARDGELLLPGCAYLAPGDRHLSIRSSARGYVCVLSDGDPVNRHKPSVDVLFESVAQELGARAIGVIMTGMGKDGASGMLAMRQAGAYTLAQDEASCVVYGMPREAVLRGGVTEVAALTDLSQKVIARYMA